MGLVSWGLVGEERKKKGEVYSLFRSIQQGAACSTSRSSARS